MPRLTPEDLAAHLNASALRAQAARQRIRMRQAINSGLCPICAGVGIDPPPPATDGEFCARCAFEMAADALMAAGTDTDAR